MQSRGEIIFGSESSKDKDKNKNSPKTQSPGKLISTSRNSKVKDFLKRIFSINSSPPDNKDTDTK